MANTFNEDFQRALASKLATQSSEAAKNASQSRLYDAQAIAVPTSTKSQTGYQNALARQANVSGNLEIAKFQDPFGKYADKDILGADFTAPGAFSFLKLGANRYNGPSEGYSSIEPAEPTDEYAAGGTVGNTDNPLFADYELYRKAAQLIGLPQAPIAAVIPQLAQYRAAQRQKMLQQLAQGGTTPTYASGGAVEFDGPGTGKSDSIPALVDNVRPAAVSDGEIRVPKHIVEYYGTKFFDTLVTKARQASRHKSAA